MRKAVLVLSFTVLAWQSAMSQTRDLSVALKFAPQEGVRSLSVVLPGSVIDHSVEVRVEDSRGLADPQLLGTGTDGDDRMFQIKASSSVVDFVRGAVAQLVTAQVLRQTSPPERVLRLRLTRFTVSESNKALGSTYLAEVHFAVSLMDAQGRILEEGAASGEANRYGRARSGENCTEVLSDALKRAFGSAISNPSIQAAWASGQPSDDVAAKPATDPQPVPKESVEERLRRLDDLLQRGVITKEEHATTRAAILKEL